MLQPKSYDVMMFKGSNGKEISPYTCWWVTVVTATVAMAFIPTATVASLSRQHRLCARIQNWNFLQ